MIGDSTAQAKSAARDLEDSDGVHALARLGLAARSVVWLVIGLLLLSVALGGSEQTDQGGALRAVSEQPFGTPLLVVLAVIEYLGRPASAAPLQVEAEVEAEAVPAMAAPAAPPLDESSLPSPRPSSPPLNAP